VAASGLRSRSSFNCARSCWCNSGLSSAQNALSARTTVVVALSALTMSVESPESRPGFTVLSLPDQAIPGLQ